MALASIMDLFRVSMLLSPDEHRDSDFAFE